MNLFAKIFLGFWVSTAAIIASWLLAGRYFTSIDDALPPSPPLPEMVQPAPRPDGRPQRPTGRQEARPVRPGDLNIRPGPSPGLMDLGPGARHIYRIYYGLQNVSRDELQGWIRQREEEAGIDIRLVDADDQEIFDRELLPGSDRVLARLAGFRRRVLEREGERVLFGQELYRPEWGNLRMIVSARPPASAVVQFLTENLWLRLLLALLISGGISYAVSRYLTRPLKDLQLASKELAGGNLAARIDVPSRGGDETDALARDFNTMAAQLQEKVNAQRRLLSDVSHELRSPLARMRVALALAEKEPGRSTDQLGRIEREAELLDELIGQLLSTPDTAAGMEDSLDLVGLLQQICEDAAFEVKAENKSLSFHTSLEDAVLRSHGELLKRAFENVIRNAVRYTGSGTTVRVDLVKAGDDFLVTVEDAGPGVPEDELEKIFDPFYRIDEARQRETGGFGLGLSIAQRAIEQHGGSITARNRQDHPGLSVSMALPAGNA